MTPYNQHSKSASAQYSKAIIPRIFSAISFFFLSSSSIGFCQTSLKNVWNASLRWAQLWCPVWSKLIAEAATPLCFCEGRGSPPTIIGVSIAPVLTIMWANRDIKWGKGSMHWRKSISNHGSEESSHTRDGTTARTGCKWATASPRPAQ